jgi:hypothetical protein
MTSGSAQDAAKREESAISVARLVSDSAAVLNPAHVQELLSVAIWMFMEARGKYKTRYVAQGSLVPDARIRHEHVIPRKTLRLAMLRCPDRVERVMRLAVACIVTEDEHRRLAAGEFGWNRYRQAGIIVIDRESHEVVDLRP